MLEWEGCSGEFDDEGGAGVDLDSCDAMSVGGDECCEGC